MNRKIEFRAWDKPNKRMLFFSNLAWEDEYDKLYFRTGILDVPLGDNMELMQFTGMKDKNGKKIFEGDIVKLETVYNKAFIKHIAKVVFEGGTFILGANTLTDSYLTFIEADSDWDLEVIGNVFENSELVGK